MSGGENDRPDMTRKGEKIIYPRNKTFEQIKRTVEKECNNGKFGVTIEYGIAMRKASNRWIMDIVHEAVNDMRDRKGR
mgnify:CR=1 FL=1